VVAPPHAAGPVQLPIRAAECTDQHQQDADRDNQPIHEIQTFALKSFHHSRPTTPK